jgi:hypothetical protein
LELAWHLTDENGRGGRRWFHRVADSGCGDRRLQPTSCESLTRCLVARSRVHQILEIRILQPSVNGLGYAANNANRAWRCHANRNRRSGRTTPVLRPVGLGFWSVRTASRIVAIVARRTLAHCPVPTEKEKVKKSRKKGTRQTFTSDAGARRTKCVRIKRRGKKEQGPNCTASEAAASQ